MKKQVFLERQSLVQQPNRLKYQHLFTENTHLSQTVCELQSQVQSLRRVNEEMLKKGGSSVPLTNELTLQNQNLQRALFRLIRSNQQLSCDVLMKDQMLAQAQRQHREIVDNYDEKIYQLRISLQNKEAAVSAMEEKMSDMREDAYGTATRVNLVYFNEINQLKAMHDRLALENSQLIFLNALKDEEIERLKLALHQFEKGSQRKSLQKRRELSAGEGSASMTRKLQARGKLEEQLTRYDNKYKHLSSSKNISTNQVSSLKFFITHLHKENRNLRAEKARAQHSLANRLKQYRMLQEAYQRIKGDLLRDRVEVQFYRNNFKELCRVPTQRRIKFYQDFHEEVLPNLERKLREKGQLVAYWKQWQGITSQIIAKCILNRNTRRCLPAKRSSSSPFKFTYTVESPKRHPCPRQKQEAIFSFINETHNVNSIINFTLEGTLRGQQRDFDDDISVIIKPKVMMARKGNEMARGGREDENDK